MKTKIKPLVGLFLIFLTLPSCMKKEFSKHDDKISVNDNRTITLEEAYDLIGQKAGVKIKSTSNLNVQNINNTVLNSNITCPSYPSIRTSSGLTDISMSSSSDDTAPYSGDGIAIPYKFSQGSTYTIEMKISNVANGIHGKPHKTQDNNPTVQVGLANVQNFPAECVGSVNLAFMGIPFYNMGKLPIQKNPYSSSDYSTTYTTKTFSLTATECFSYLWINFVPPNGGYYNNNHISYIKITRSGENFSIEGPNDFTTSTAVYKVKSNSFLLDHPFVWRTSGNIEIVGDSIGSSLTVKRSNNNPLEGSISVFLGGCGEIAIKKFNACETQNSFVTVNGPSIIKVGQTNREFTWNVTDTRYTNLTWSISTPHLNINSSTPNKLFISVPRNYPIINQVQQGDYVTLTFTAQGPCGIGRIDVPIFISTGNPPINPQQ